MDLENWPLYVNDSGVVMCYAGGERCDGEFLWTLPARRVTLADVHEALRKHIAAEHPDAE